MLFALCTAIWYSYILQRARERCRERERETAPTREKWYWNQQKIIVFLAFTYRFELINCYGNELNFAWMKKLKREFFGVFSLQILIAWCNKSPLQIEMQIIISECFIVSVSLIDFLLHSHSHIPGVTFAYICMMT